MEIPAGYDSDVQIYLDGLNFSAVEETTDIEATEEEISEEELSEEEALAIEQYDGELNSSNICISSLIKALDYDEGQPDYSSVSTTVEDPEFQKSQLVLEFGRDYYVLIGKSDAEAPKLSDVTPINGTVTLKYLDRVTMVAAGDKGTLEKITDPKVPDNLKGLLYKVHLNSTGSFHLYYGNEEGTQLLGRIPNCGIYTKKIPRGEYLVNDLRPSEENQKYYIYVSSFDYNNSISNAYIDSADIVAINNDGNVTITQIESDDSKTPGPALYMGSKWYELTINSLEHYNLQFATENPSGKNYFYYEIERSKMGIVMGSNVDRPTDSYMYSDDECEILLKRNDDLYFYKESEFSYGYKEYLTLAFCSADEVTNNNIKYLTSTSGLTIPANLKVKYLHDGIFSFYTNYPGDYEIKYRDPNTKMESSVILHYYNKSVALYDSAEVDGSTCSIDTSKITEYRAITSDEAFDKSLTFYALISDIGSVGKTGNIALTETLNGSSKEVYSASYNPQSVSNALTNVKDNSSGRISVSRLSKSVFRDGIQLNNCILLEIKINILDLGNDGYSAYHLEQSAYNNIGDVLSNSGSDISFYSIEWKDKDITVTGPESVVYRSKDGYTLPAADEIKVYYKGRELVADQDYEIDWNYSEATSKNGGVISMDIFGKGNFQGYKEFKYITAPASISTINFEVDSVYDPVIKGPSYTCTGKTTDVLEQEVVQNVDFTVDYGYVRNTSGAYVKAKTLKPGEDYYAKISGKGNYKDVIYSSYTYEPAELKEGNLLRNDRLYANYTGLPYKFNSYVLFKGYTLVEGVDFEIEGTDSCIDYGCYTVNLRGINNYTGSIELSVSINKEDISKANVKLNKTSMKWDDPTPEATVTFNGIQLTKDVDYTVYFNKKAGISDYIIRAKGNNFDGSVTVPVKVGAKGDISKAKTEIKKVTYNGQYYRWSDIVEKITVNGEDVSSSNCVSVEIDKGTLMDAGKYSITFYGMPENGYIGTKKVDVTILPYDLSKCQPNYFSADSAKYLGKNKVPSSNVTVRSSVGYLSLNRDYTLTYGKKYNAGINTITIDGKGNYTGKYTLTYMIEPCPLSDVTVISQYYRNYSNDVVKINTKLDGFEYKTDYSVSAIDAESNPIPIDSKGIITVNPEVNWLQLIYSGKGNVSGNKTVNVSISDRELTPISKCNIYFDDDVSSLTFSGSAYEPKVIVKNDAADTLIKGTDYDVFYFDNVNVGKATVSITGKGKYEGTLSKQFEIKKAPKSAVKCQSNSSQVELNEKNQLVLPEYSLYIDSNGNGSYDSGEYQLVANVDYSTAVCKCTIAPSEDVYIESTIKNKNIESGKNKYNVGSVYINMIDTWNSSDDFTVTVKDYVYTGKDIVPAVTVKYKNATLKQGTDYSIKFCKEDSNNGLDAVRNAGTYRIAITGKGKYVFGSSSFASAQLNSGCSEYFIIKDKTFNVTKADMSKAKVGFFKKSLSYASLLESDGTLIDSDSIKEIIITNIESVEYNKLPIDYDEYAVYISNHMKPGKAQITLSSKPDSNYYGDLVVNLPIEGKINLATDSAVSVTTPSSVGVEYSPAGAKYNLDVCYNGVELQEGVDYKLLYTNNTKLFTESHKAATVKIQGMGAYTGTFPKTYSFFVRECDLSNNLDINGAIKASAAKEYSGKIDDESFDVFVYATDYTGNYVKFDPKLKYDGKNLKLHQDYDYVLYKWGTNEWVDSATNVGEYECRILGHGNYCGEVFNKVMIKIIPADINKVSVSTKTLEYKPYGEINAIQSVKYNKAEVSKADYRATYGIEVKSSGKTYFASSLDKWVKEQFNLNYYNTSAGKYIYDYGEAGTHTVYLCGEGNFCGVKEVKYTIKGIDINKCKFQPLPTQTYGSTESPSYKMNISYNGVRLDSSCYKVQCNDYSNVGTVNVTVTGCKHFCGTKKLTYKVQPKEPEQSKVSIYVGDCIYTGSALKPNVYVTVDGHGLSESEYTVTFTNNINPASASADKAPTVTVKLKGRYTGTFSRNFAIVRKSVSSDDIVVKNVKSGAYKSNPVINVDGKKLVNGKDYVCDYTYVNKTYVTRNGSIIEVKPNSVVKDGDKIPSGTQLAVKVTIKGNYTGSNVTKNFYSV